MFSHFLIESRTQKIEMLFSSLIKKHFSQPPTKTNNGIRRNQRTHQHRARELPERPQARQDIWMARRQRTPDFTQHQGANQGTACGTSSNGPHQATHSSSAVCAHPTQLGNGRPCKATQERRGGNLIKCNLYINQ